MDRRSFLKLSGGTLAALASGSLWAQQAQAATAGLPVVGRDRYFHDRAGRSYRIEPAQHSVVGLDEAGRERWRYGSDPRTGPNYPIAMAEDAGGRLYVLDKGNARIHVLDAEGRCLDVFSAGGRGCSDLAIDERDRLYVCLPVQNQVRVLDLKGQLLATLSGEHDPRGWNAPRSLAFDLRGNVHVLDAGHCRVVVIRPDGTLVGTYGAGQFLGPRAIRRDEAGRLVIADSASGRLHMFTPDGAFVSTWRPTLPDGRAAVPLHMGQGPGNRLVIAASPTA